MVGAKVQEWECLLVEENQYNKLSPTQFRSVFGDDDPNRTKSTPLHLLLRQLDLDAHRYPHQKLLTHPYHRLHGIPKTMVTNHHRRNIKCNHC